MEILQKIVEEIDDIRVYNMMNIRDNSLDTKLFDVQQKIYMALDSFEILNQARNKIPSVIDNECEKEFCTCKKPKRYDYGVRECEMCGKKLPVAK